MEKPRSFIARFRRFRAVRGKRLPTVTIDGLAGSGKNTLALAVAKRCGLRFTEAGELFREAAQEQGESLEAFLRDRPDRLDIRADRRSLELAAEGGWVIVGRLTGRAAGDFSDLRIFLKAPPAVRAGRIAKREKLSPSAAMRKVVGRDGSDSRKYARLYSADISDLSPYHLVIDNTFIGISETGRLLVPLVVRILRNRGFKDI